MSKHIVYDEEVDFHTGTEHADYWLSEYLKREGFKRLAERARRGEEIKFIDHHGNKCCLIAEGEDKELHVRKKD